MNEAFAVIGLGFLACVVGFCIGNLSSQIFFTAIGLFAFMTGNNMLLIEVMARLARVKKS